eukprot:TRINITY_DN12289_c0_g1_i1.p1 TRINITY_DN12289_c0_g1~~TRINITY_DN12289_c0_g1_i1.p1  ORF type:complete len:167 (-),score=18.42 TRINITY_DN12289_c0_g1_i1:28-528(-)
MFSLVCDPRNEYNRGKIYFWIWIFHLSKWYEFVDTLILLLEGGRLQFLHVYHHIFTFFITWLALHLGATCQWVGMAMNCSIHVIMYMYYSLKTMGYDPWWKIFLTRAQIFQFFINLLIGIYWFIQNHSQPKGCSGDVYSIGITFFANFTFLVLFLKLYFKIYSTKQ